MEVKRFKFWFLRIIVNMFISNLKFWLVLYKLEKNNYKYL